MNNEERKQEWIRKTIEREGRFLTRQRCDKCGEVKLCISCPVDLSFICLECMADNLFKKPDLDVKDFARI